MRKPRKLNTTAALDLEWSFQEYIAARPWERLKDHHVFRLPHPYHAHDNYATAMGDAGQLFGIALHTGPQAQGDVITVISGGDAVLATRLSAMTNDHPDSPEGQPPRMLCHRIEPATGMAGIITQALFWPMPPITTAERRALDHALKAATDLVSNPAHPPDLVRDRDHQSEIHLVTSVLQDSAWQHSVEVVTVSAED